MVDWEQYLYAGTAAAFARVGVHQHKHAWSELDGKVDRIDSDLENFTGTGDQLFE